MMPENEQTKVCHLCAETIKAAAKVCPHCRYCQKKWSLTNPYVKAIAFGILYVIAISYLAAMIEGSFGHKTEFAEYRDEIKITSSQVSYRMSNATNLLVTVVGTLTNRSEIGWKSVSVESQFFDKSGTMIDAITVTDFATDGVILLPHGEAAYKVERRAARPESDYATHKEFVRYAKDIDAWF